MRALLFLGAIGLFIAAAYNTFIEFGVSNTAKQVEISQVEANPPRNRHVIVVGAKPLFNEAVKFCKQKRGVVYSEEYYIPLKDAAFVGIESLPPRLLLKISKQRMDQMRQGRGLDTSGI